MGGEAARVTIPTGGCAGIWLRQAGCPNGGSPPSEGRPPSTGGCAGIWLRQARRLKGGRPPSNRTAAAPADRDDRRALRSVRPLRVVARGGFHYRFRAEPARRGVAPGTGSARPAASKGGPFSFNLTS